MLVLPPSAFAKTISFHFDAEQGYIIKKNNTGWSQAQKLVSLSQKFAKSGKSALRHELNPTVEGTNQTGKVLKFFNPDQMPQHLSPGEYGFKQAYYSAWYYIEEGITDFDSKNSFQFKTDNRDTTIPGGVKNSVGFERIKDDPNRVQLALKIWYCGLPSGTFPQYKQIPGMASCFLWNPNPVSTVPLKKWFHIEVYLKAASKGGHMIVWKDGVEIFNLSHPNLDTLRSAKKTGNLSDNKYLYWGIGSYGGPKSDRVVFYTDEAMVTDYPVHQNSSTDTTPPSPPSGLRFQ
jgi:hypothetical protein